MRTLIPFLILVSVFCLSAVQAQTDTVPADPGQFFDASVDIEYIQAEPENPGFLYDNDVRIYVIDGALYRYPTEVHRIYTITPFDDNRAFFAVSLVSSVSEPYPDVFVWIFDKQQKTLQPFNAYCIGSDGVEPHSSELIDELWTVKVEANAAYLCNRVTGELSDPLPDDYNWIFDTSTRPRPLTSVSPDRAYVALLGQDSRNVQDRFSRSVELFSFNTQTGHLLSLGTMEAGYSLYFDLWVGHQITIQTGDTTSVGFRGIYIADATQPNNLEYAIGAAGYSPSFLDNPPRYVLSFDAPYNQTPCGRTTFYVETRETVELDLDGLCRPEYGDIEGVGYYRDVPMGISYECCEPVPTEVAEVPLVRYDTRTGERTELYRGELEAIYWVSPDDRYAILLTDRNGKIDFFPYTVFNDDRLGLPFVELIDLQTDEILASTIVDELIDFNGMYPIQDWAVNHSMNPLPDGTFVMIYCIPEATTCAREGNAASHLTLTNEGVTETWLVNDPIMLTPDRSGLLVWSQPRPKYQPPAASQGVNIYDLRTGELRPFIKDLDTQKYSFSIENRGDSLFIDVSPRETGLPGGSYSVFFNSSNNPYIRIELPSELAIGEYACILTTDTGVNIRVDPAGDTERFGTAEKGEKLLAVGQTVSSYDKLVWWALDGGGWVRSDFVSETSACAELPDTSLSETSPPPTDSPIPAPDNQASVTCQLIVLTGANLRTGPGVEFERAGSAGIDQSLFANGQYPNTQDYFTWWHLETGEWIREDFVMEDATCSQLPVISE